MNILVVSQHLEKGGGAARSAYYLAEGLSRDYNVTFMTFFKAKNSHNKRNFEEFCLNLNQNRCSKSIYFYFSIVLNLFRIRKFLFQNKIDSIITNSVGSEIPFLLLKFLRFKFNLYICVRGNPNYLFSNSIKKKFVYYFFNKYPNAVITSNSFSKRILVNDFNIDRVQVINNFFDIEENRLLGKEFFSTYFESPVFLTIGRLDKNKRVDLIIKAFSNFYQNYRYGYLVILGDGEELSNLKSYSKRLNIFTRIIFEGNVENVHKYLRNSDLFLFASKYEGFGNVLVESLIQNRLVISTDYNYGAREILAPELGIDEKIRYPYYSDWGVLIEPNDENIIIEQLYNNMVAFISGNFSKRYSNISRRGNDFSLNKLIKSWHNLLK